MPGLGLGTLSLVCHILVSHHNSEGQPRTKRGRGQGQGAWAGAGGVWGGGGRGGNRLRLMMGGASREWIQGGVVSLGHFGHPSFTEVLGINS